MIKANVQPQNMPRFLGLFDSVIKNASLKAAEKIADQIRREIPVKEGRLRESVKIEMPKVVGKKWITVISVGENIPYAWAVWKGLNPEIYYVMPRNSPFMIFPREDWPQYDGRFGFMPYFIFKRRLSNNIPANDFIERGVKIKGNLLERILYKQFKVTYG